MSASNWDVVRGSIYVLLGLSMAGCGSTPGLTAPAAPTGGEEAPPDPARAAAPRYSMACREGEASACFQLGVLYERGRGVGRDEAAAARLFSTACRRGHAAACSHLGALHEHGRGVAADEQIAADLYSKACDAGDAAGCSSLGVLHEKACDAGSGASCAKLAERLAQGAGMARDEGRAATLYSKACDSRESTGCFELAVLVEEGRGASKDEARARALYKKACAANDVRGCINFYSDACDAGDGASCFDLGVLVEEGRGTTRNQTRAAELYARACKGGHATACAPQRLEAHHATLLRGLANRQLARCRDEAPPDAVRTTANDLRVYAGAPALPESDLNVRWEPSGMVSSEFTRFAGATGSSRFEAARALLSAPATLVLDVVSEVPATQSLSQLAISGVSSGFFSPGSVTARQVRFDARGRPTCETRVTVKNSSLTVRYGSTWREAAREQLLDKLHDSF